MSNRAFSALQRYLANTASGDIADIYKYNLETLLSECWKEFSGSDREGMRADKLSRMENAHWAPPRLSFEIERHGGAVLGSVYAEMQYWMVDLEQKTTSCTISGKRLILERQKPINVTLLVTKVVDSVTRRTHSEWLTWVSQERVRVKIGVLIPDTSGVKQTVAGRRKRFAKALAQALAERGWQKVTGTSPHTFQSLNVGGGSCRRFK